MVVRLLFVQFAPFVCGAYVFLFRNVVLSILSSFAVIWVRKRDLALNLYCALAVLWSSLFCPRSYLLSLMATSQSSRQSYPGTNAF